MAPIVTHNFHSNGLINRDTSPPTAPPEAPPASSISGSWGASKNDGWTPSAVIGIVAAIVLVLVMVPLIAIILRRYERKRCLELLPDATPIGLASSKSSVREDQSLKSIMVTREVQRESLRVAEVRRPEEAYRTGNEKGWSRTEVRGGQWR